MADELSAAAAAKGHCSVAILFTSKLMLRLGDTTMRLSTKESLTRNISTSPIVIPIP